MFKIPDKIKVGGHEFKVIKDYKFIERYDHTAQFDNNLSEIRLGCFDHGGRPLSKSKQEADFIHELLHAIDCVYNAFKLDEDTNERLAQGLYAVLKDNNMLK